MVCWQSNPCVIVSRIISPGSFGSSTLKNSLRSSNIFFDLPMLLFVFVAEMRPGFHIAAFFCPSVFTVCNNAHGESPLHRCVQHENIQCLHFLFCLVCTSFDVFHPVFLILFCSVHIVVCIACERGVAVLATSDACAFGVFRLCGQPSVASFVICRVFLLACFLFVLLHFLLV